MQYIYEWSYYDIIPNNKQVHIYQYHTHQNMDINNPYNIFLLAHKRSILGLLDMLERMCDLDRHHSNCSGSLLRILKSLSHRIMLDY